MVCSGCLKDVVWCCIMDGMPSSEPDHRALEKVSMHESSMYDQAGWTGFPPTQVVKRKGEYLFGVAPCLAALQAKRRKVHAIFLKQGGEVNKKRQIKKQVRAIVTDNRMLTLVLVSQSQALLFLCESLAL